MTEPNAWADAFGTLAFFVGVALCIFAHGYVTGRKDRGGE